MTRMPNPVLAVCVACLLSGCAGDQANRQGSDFRDLRIVAAGAERPPGRGNDRAVADDTVRHGLAKIEARQDATQQSMSGLGAQVREIRADVESLAKVTVAMHSEIRAEIHNELRAQGIVNAAAIAETDARLDARLDLSAKVEAMATAVASLSANINALAQAQASAQVGVGNEMRSTISELKAAAGRDVNTSQFTQEMAGVYERFIASFVWSAGIAAVVGICAIGGAALVLVRSKEHSRARAASRERELRSAVVAAMAGVERGQPARQISGLPGRLDDDGLRPEEVPW